MNRLKTVIAAGMLTGLVLATMVALGIRNATVQMNTPPSPGTGSASEVDMQTMLEREAEYRAQLEAANQRIQELQAQQTQPAFFGGEHEEEAHEEWEGD